MSSTVSGTRDAATLRRWRTVPRRRARRGRRATASSASAGPVRSGRSCSHSPTRRSGMSSTGSTCSATPPSRHLASSLRTRLLVFRLRHFGTVFVLALMQRAEGRSPYETDADASQTMAADERIHGEVLRGLAARGRQRLSGTFRAAVFGANDGLVSNLALVLGIGADRGRRAHHLVHRHRRPAGRSAVDGRRGIRLGTVPARTAESTRRTRDPTPRCPTSTWTPTNSRWSIGPGGWTRPRPRSMPEPCWPPCTWTPTRPRPPRSIRTRRSGRPGARRSPASASSPPAR